MLPQRRAPSVRAPGALLADQQNQVGGDYVKIGGSRAGRVITAMGKKAKKVLKTLLASNIAVVVRRSFIVFVGTIEDYIAMAGPPLHLTEYLPSHPAAPSPSVCLISSRGKSNSGSPAQHKAKVLRAGKWLLRGEARAFALEF